MEYSVGVLVQWLISEEMFDTLHGDMESNISAGVQWLIGEKDVVTPCRVSM